MSKSTKDDLIAKFNELINLKAYQGYLDKNAVFYTHTLPPSCFAQD